MKMRQIEAHILHQKAAKTWTNIQKAARNLELVGEGCTAKFAIFLHKTDKWTYNRYSKFFSGKIPLRTAAKSSRQHRKLEDCTKSYQQLTWKFIFKSFNRCCTLQMSLNNA